MAAQALQNLSVSSLVIGMNADDLSSEASQYNMDKVLKVKNDLVSSMVIQVVKQVIDPNHQNIFSLVIAIRFVITFQIKRKINETFFSRQCII